MIKAAVIGLLLAPTIVQDPAPQEVSPSDFARYRNCLRTAVTDPIAAIDAAVAWRGQSGGLPARHCQAVALVALERFGDAIELLKAMISDLEAGRGMTFEGAGNSLDADKLRVDMLAQLGNAQLLDGQPRAARETLTQALILVGDQPEHGVHPILTDRARAAAIAGDWKSAIADLETALTRRPDDVDTLVLLAAAHRENGSFAAATRVLEKALTIAPDTPAALMERAQLHLAADNLEAAQEDWYRIIRVAPGTPLADLAQRFLDASQLEVVPEN